MATGDRFYAPYYVPVDGNGDVEPGAKLFFYISETSTPQDTFSDVDLTVPNTNPVEANGAGQFPAIFLGTGRYKVILKNADDTLVWTADPVLGSATGDGSTFDTMVDLRAYGGPHGEIGLISANAIGVLLGYYAKGDLGGSQVYWDAVSTEADDGGYVIKPDAVSGSDPGRWKRLTSGDAIPVEFYGTKGDGTTDDTAAVQKAMDRMRTKGGVAQLGTGRYRITSTLTYTSAGVAPGLRLRGNGMTSSFLIYDFANGRSLIKIRGTVPAAFMEGGGITDFTIQSPANEDGTPKYGFFSQQAAIDFGNWIDFQVSRLGIKSVRGHGIWAPMQNVSVNNNTGVGVDLPNNKPWCWVDRTDKHGRPAHLLARVDPSTGAITGFLIYRAGTGYTSGAHVRVTGCGTGFAGTITTELNTTGTVTSGSMDVTAVASLAGVQPGFDISGAGIPGGTSVVSVSGTTISMNQAATGTSAGTAVRVAPQGGGVMAVNISNGGSGYYEENDHILDNPDPYTVGVCDISENFITGCDGVGINLPHFAAGSLQMRTNYITSNAFGGILYGGNGTIIANNSIAFNGMNLTEGGWWPGVYLRRENSNVQNVAIRNNELDSNTLCHVLLDGTDGVLIENNRCNSWVTIWTTMTDWTEQIPNPMVKVDIGNNRVANRSYRLIDNLFRAQAAGAAVPTAITNTTNGNPVVIVPKSVIASTTFKVGGRVEILDLSGNPIIVGPGTALETTITNIVSGTDTATLTLALAPTQTITGATIRVKINNEFSLYIDNGRSVNNSASTIRNALNISGISTFVQAGNFRSNDGLGSQHDWIEQSFRRRGVPGLSCSSGRFNQGDTATIPASSVAYTVPFVSNLDPEGKLEQNPPKSGIFTGRYSADFSGIYRCSGSICLDNPSAGDVFSIDMMCDFNTIATDGTVTPNTASVRHRNYKVSGYDQEQLNFDMTGPITLFDTYIGTDQPKQYPSPGEDGLVWWNPIAKTYKRWNGTTLAWQAVTGTFTVPFDVMIFFKVVVRTTRGSSIAIDTTAGNTSWVCWERIG